MMFLSTKYTWLEQSSTLDDTGKVAFLLLQLGIPQKLDGFRYLRNAILLYRNDPSRRFLMDIFPGSMGAEDLKSCSAQVDQAIRRAIKAGFVNGNPDLWADIFGVGKNGILTKPSNVTFIKGVSLFMDVIYGHENTDMPGL